ncbi:hypothetical protein BGZ58_009581 [Dissophora ornata]|nr:hypothetical protein BGZ58_009581 [Dissophora ornata]
MKQKLYGAGSRMLEKIEHHETFFKQVPAKDDVTPTTMVSFMYPSSLKESKVNADFKTLIEQRIPYHRKYMIYSALWVPVTSLFTIVPLVPNIPFFYNAFRLWSHWKAYSGAKHLDVMVKSGSINFQPSDVLDLGLHHDPEFAVFFTESHQLSKRRHPRKKYIQQDPKGPVITESSGDVTPSLSNSNGASFASKKTEDVNPTHHSPRTVTREDDPMSMTDHVVHEGFISDAEVEAICQTFREAPMLSREIRRARLQEAEKFVKEKMKDGSSDRTKQN